MKALILSTAVAILFAGAAQAQSPPAGCQAPERRQFDFWVGRWDVYPTGKDAKVAESLIENLYLGCAIRENWMPSKSTPGGSYSAYVPADRGWRQIWLDASGSWVEFKGGWTGEAMVLTGRWPQPGKPNQLTRMTYTRAPEGSVRQFGQSSDDEGETWQASFDFTYRPAKQAPAT